MSEYCHYISGFFTHRDEAESAISSLVEKGFAHERLQIYAADSSSPRQEAKSDGVLQDVLVDGAIGTAVGTGVGALGSVALAASSVTLFVASPLVAPLMLLGWGASIGGLIGATVGATEGPGNKEGWLADLISDAIAAGGQVVLVVETQNEQETASASEVIKDAVGKSKNINPATA